MPQRRVVITGIGMVTPIGIGKEWFWKAALTGHSGVRRIQAFDPSGYKTQIAADVKDFYPSSYLDPGQANRMDRCIQFAVAAAKMAVEDAAIDLSREFTDRIGVSMGSGLGGMVFVESQLVQLYRCGRPQDTHPLLVPKVMPSSTSAQVSMVLGLRGPSWTVAAACSSGAHAVTYAAEMIKWGRCDLMIAGGAEACIQPLTMAGFSALRVLSCRNDEPERASRPFDRWRDGFVMGEGAGVLVMEDLVHARRRKADIYAEFLGYGAASEAYHMVMPEPSGREIARCMELALKDARIPPEQVGYVNAHGTSTLLNDAVETRAMKAVFREHAARLLVNSTKSLIGHTIGAAGAIELAVCALTIQTGMVHPTINQEERDPECDLNYVPNEACEKPVRVALSNAFAFGGSNVSVVLGAFP
ncbi:MAG: beta-ketoacyl-ACP synthase II [Nitrospirae bacterium]|nr:beta-ketoacyl-ACP synthase II [Nitrospirota bacterium]